VANAHKRLSGRTIRVAVPIPSEPTKYLSDGGFTPQGPTWDFIQFLANKANMSIDLRIISMDSIDNTGREDNWWGCVHEVAVNTTDLCIGDFWATPSRRAYMAPMGTFSTPIGSSNFYFVTRAEVATSKDNFSSPLSPFTMELRILILAVFVWTAITYVLVEQFAKYRRGMKNVEEEGIHLKRFSTVEECINRIYSLFANVRITWFEPSTGFPSTWPGRLVSLAFALFMLVIIQYWGSFITASMVSKQTEFNNPMSLKQASEANDIICAFGWIGTDLVNQDIQPNVMLSQTDEMWNPTAVSPLISTDSEERSGLPENLKGTLDAIIDGHCKHSVMDLDMLLGFFQQPSLDVSKYCKFGPAGGSLFSRIDIAMPVSVEIAAELSFMMHNYVSDFERLVESWKAKNPLPVQCSGSLSVRMKMEPGMTTLGISDMSTELLILFASTLFAFVLAYIVPQEIYHQNTGKDQLSY